MDSDSITNLPVKSLKAILFRNHVNASYIVEKPDLVEKVQSLIESEREYREREADARRREEEEITRQQQEALEEHEQKMRETREQNPTGSEQQDKESSTESAKPAPKAASKSLERNGLCVICQDEEANIAIVDCGYVFRCF
jgi:hypothetical protein